MAKDRARDSRRVYQSPISHVKLRNPSYGKVEGKYDSEGNTDSWRERNTINDMEDVKKYNEKNPSSVIQIRG